MQIWLALFALITLMTSPALAIEEKTLDAPQPELAPSMGDYAVPVPPSAEAAVPQPENLTDSKDLDEQELNEGLISVGPNGFRSENQPN